MLWVDPEKDKFSWVTRDGGRGELEARCYSHVSLNAVYRLCLPDSDRKTFRKEMNEKGNESRDEAAES